jgi:hypothetical protein
MGERILDRMNRLYKEYQAEQHQKAAIQDTMTQPTVTVVPKVSISSETIDTPASRTSCVALGHTVLFKLVQSVISTWAPAV